MVEMTGSHAKIVHRPKPQDDPRQRRPDLSKAQELRAWSPRTPLRQGLKSTIACFDMLLADDGVRAMLVNA
jgi:UDP-glucuronate decarboxylase